MEKQISAGLKTTFLIHIVVGTIFGLIYLLIPDVWGNLVGWPVQDQTANRLLGAAILGYTASSWWAYRETLWERVKIVVQMEIVWMVLATLVLLLGMFTLGLPTIGWLNVVLMGGFAVAFIVF
jgi:hypothetical protein